MKRRGGRTEGMQLSLLFVVLWVLSQVLMVPVVSGNDGRSTVEKRLTNAVKEAYGSEDDVYVKVEKLPRQLGVGAKVKTIELVKMPDKRGAGLALVQYTGADSRMQSSYVAFRAFEKKDIFYLKRNMKKGERLEQADLHMKQAFVGEKSYLYPGRLSEISGKVLRRDMGAGSPVTSDAMEEPRMVRKGQSVIVVCQNERLVVQTLGRASENGRRGETIRVKSLSSDREVSGRVADNGTVVVDY